MALCVALLCGPCAAVLFAEDAKQSPPSVAGGSLEGVEKSSDFQERMNNYRQTLGQVKKEESVASAGLNMAKSLAIVVGFFLVGSFIYKKFIYKGPIHSGAARSLQLVERLALGSKAHVYLVRVHDKQLVLAVTDTQVTQLNPEVDLLSGLEFKKVEEELCSEISQSS
jgi:flagellar biosynthetic protein FliO